MEPDPKPDGTALRILFAVRDDLHEHPGGDTVQIVNTARALQDMGVSVDVSADHEIDATPYDCVHLWHLERVHETYVHLLNARRAAKPVVLSPIYWPWDCDARTGCWRSWCEDAKNIWRFLRARSPKKRRAIGKALLIGWGRCRQELLDSARLILPNSQAEADMLQTEIGSLERCRVVPNGVSEGDCQAALVNVPEGPREGVLCVGHFDARKNQLGLIEALRDLEVKVTFVGRARPMHESYYRKCRAQAGPRMEFAGARKHEEVLVLMRRARVHVCASHFETPGLANLEAAVMGCNLALAESPPVREYFGHEAVYFQSDDIPGIRSAVLKALDSPPPGTLARRILPEYNWRMAARVTLAAYREVLGGQWPGEPRGVSPRFK